MSDLLPSLSIWCYLTSQLLRFSDGFCKLMKKHTWNEQAICVLFHAAPSCMLAAIRSKIICYHCSSPVYFQYRIAGLLERFTAKLICKVFKVYYC